MNKNSNPAFDYRGVTKTYYTGEVDVRALRGGWAAHTPPHDGSWWPEWQKWLAGHSGGKIRPIAIGAPGKGYGILRDAPGEYVMMK